MSTDDFKNFVLMFVKLFVAEVPEVGEDTTRFALVTFSDPNDVQLVFNYKANNFDRDTIIAAVDTAEHLKGLTMAGAALKVVHETVNKPSQGFGLNGDGSRFKTTVVLITDGKATDQSILKDQADIIKAEDDTYIYTIGVGDRISDDQLELVATFDGFKNGVGTDF